MDNSSDPELDESHPVTYHLQPNGALHDSSDTAREALRYSARTDAGVEGSRIVPWEFAPGSRLDAYFASLPGEHQYDDANNNANDSSTEQGDDASTENTRPRRRFQLPDQSLTPTTPSEARFAARYNLYRDTIVQFGARHPWMQLHAAALARAETTIKHILTRLCYVAAVKNTAAPEIHARQALIRTHGRAAFANVQPVVLINHVEWIRFIGRFPTLVSQVMKHVKWVELLSGEYRKAEPVWALFWDRVEAGRDVEDNVMDQMAAMHKKRAFLQGKIVDGEAVLAILFSQEPMWLRWQVSGL